MDLLFIAIVADGGTEAMFSESGNITIISAVKI